MDQMHHTKFSVKVDTVQFWELVFLSSTDDRSDQFAEGGRYREGGIGREI